MSAIITVIGCLRACQLFHSNLLQQTLHLPITFFDTTPIGRIMNRFSKDVHVLDKTLPSKIRSWIASFFNVISIFIMIIYLTPIFLGAFFPIFILYICILIFYIASLRQIARLEAMTRSKIYSQFCETFVGQSTIRAYKDEERFIKLFEAKVDFNQKHTFATISVNRWTGIRLEIVGSFVIFFAALLIVLQHETISPAIAGLSITYALQITTLLTTLVRNTSNIESDIIAIERLEEYSTLKPEDKWVKETDVSVYVHSGKTLINYSFIGQRLVKRW